MPGTATDGQRHRRCTLWPDENDPCWVNTFEFETMVPVLNLCRTRLCTGCWNYQVAVICAWYLHMASPAVTRCRSDAVTIQDAFWPWIILTVICRVQMSHTNHLERMPQSAIDCLSKSGRAVFLIVYKTFIHVVIQCSCQKPVCRDFCHCQCLWDCLNKF